MIRVLRLLLAGVFLSFLFASTSFAQSTFGSIVGTVADPSGAVVPGADVLVTNEGTGATRHVTVTSAGVFNVPNLDLGSYKVRVTSKGFETYERGGLVLYANQVINIDVHLKLGATSQVLEVTGESPIIATETHDIGSSMTAQQAEALPLIGRQAADQGVYTYVTLATGTATVSSSSLPVFQGTRVANGTQATMDGINVAAYENGASPVSMDMEMVGEIKIESAVAPAEFATAGNIQVVSRGGTNQYHGALFETYNGNGLNARDFYDTSVDKRVYNNFGATLGGPIKKNKLFFLGDYEGSREGADQTLQQTVPIAAWRDGNFQSLCSSFDANGNCLTGTSLRDPYTGQSYPNNVIPSGISPVSQAIQSYAYPLPNINGQGFNWEEKAASQNGFTRYNRADARADYNLSTKDTVFARVSWLRAPYFTPGVYPLHRNQDRYAQDAVGSYNRVITPNMLNEVRAGATYHRNRIDCNINGGQLLSQWGIQGVSTNNVLTGPDFAMSGKDVGSWNPSSGTCYHYDFPDTSIEALDNLTWTKGRHFMKFGFDDMRERFNGNAISPSAYGVYSFTGYYTNNDYADFLLGIPRTTQLAPPQPDRKFRGNLIGMYAQDQFKFSRDLTLNYGVRWELPRPYYDARGQIYTYDAATGGLVVPDMGMKLIDPYYPKNVPIVSASQAGLPVNSLFHAYDKDIEPRVGFAYKLFGRDDTVLRGGYGIYSNIIYQTMLVNQTGGPFSGNITYNNANIVSNALVGTPFTFPSPWGASGSLPGTQNVGGVYPNLKDPYTQQWEVSLERQVHSYGFRASYIGTRSVNLLVNQNVNEPAPSLPAPLGTAPAFSSASYPNQHFATINYYSNGGNEFYEALELQAQRKLGKNLTFNAGFTWAKDMTDTQDYGGGGGSNYAGPQLQNQFCRACQKANNAMIPPKRFYAYGVYRLPVGKGQYLLPNTNRLVQGVLGGWQTSWAVEMQSGQWFTPSFSTYDPSNTGVIGGVPDRLAGASLYPANKTVTNWFNPAAFQIPGCPTTDPLCQKGGDWVSPGRFGTSGWDYMQGPPVDNLDLSLSKDFKIRESMTLRFTASGVDALNHPHFTPPASNISNTGTVGLLTGTGTVILGEYPDREFDFGLRLMF